VRTHLSIVDAEYINGLQNPAWLGQLVATVPVGIVVINQRGEVTWINNELSHQFGYDISELIGQPLELLLPDRVRNKHATLRDQYAADPMARAMGSGRDLFGRRKDGSEVPVEIGLRKLDTKEGPMFVATVVDISVRRRDEQKLQRVIEAAPCGILMADVEQRIVLVNNHLLQLFGYQREELLRNSVQSLIPLRTKHVANICSGVLIGEPVELPVTCKDGKPLLVEVGLSPVQMENGPCVLATILDVTARKQVEQQLKLANADLEEFNYIAAHDLRSPLRGIGDLAHWIEEDLGDNVTPEIMQHVERMNARVNRMDALIENLLTYARAGTRETQYETVDLQLWLREEIELLHVPDNITVSIRSEHPTARILKTPLSTVLRNLISNAIKYNDRERGEIDVEFRMLDTSLGILVRDNGPGIPAGSRERIFKLFQRLSSVKEGSGIGLSVVKRIVETHGGSVAVLNRDDGKSGAVFLVKWPMTRGSTK